MYMSIEKYGPLSFYIGKWESEQWTGENRAPGPSRMVENTKFRQEMIFEPIGSVNNHEQKLFCLRYTTKAWEEGSTQDPFHEEVGYFIWDKESNQVLKSFIVPRGIAVNAGGSTTSDAREFTVSADVGSETYGISSNLFLDKQFKSIRYDITFKQLDENTFSYNENTQIKINSQEEIFHHTEKNVLRRVL
jgi:hypothetical protein